MKTAIITVTDRGRKLAEKISGNLGNSAVIDHKSGFSNVLAEIWGKYDGFVFIMAVGAVVRLIAPLLRDKYTDPCVVAVDELGRFSISLLSGHIGGGNELAEKIAIITGGQAVVTTASDILGHTAVDLWAKKNSLVTENRHALTRASARLVNSGRLKIYSDVPLSNIPHDFEKTEECLFADIIVSHRIFTWPDGALVLRPRIIVVGIGCNRGVRPSQITQALKEAFKEHGVSEKSVRNLASIDLKKNEKGLLEFASEKGLEIDFFTAGQLNTVKCASSSDAVIKATGARGVAEPAACLGAGSENLVIRKMKWKDVTLAAAMAPSI